MSETTSRKLKYRSEPLSYSSHMQKQLWHRTNQSVHECAWSGWAQPSLSPKCNPLSYFKYLYRFISTLCDSYKKKTCERNLPIFLFLDCVGIAYRWANFQIRSDVFTISKNAFAATNALIFYRKTARCIVMTSILPCQFVIVACIFACKFFIQIDFVIDKSFKKSRDHFKFGRFFKHFKKKKN